MQKSSLKHLPGGWAFASDSSSCSMGKWPRGWWENESMKEELLMPKLIPVTPIPRESALTHPNTVNGTVYRTIVFIYHSDACSCALTYANRRSARSSLPPGVVYSSKWTAVRSVWLQNKVCHDQYTHKDKNMMKCLCIQICGRDSP